MMAGESLIVVTTEMLVSLVVSGTEDSLADCRHDGRGITIYSQYRDAGVICGKCYREKREEIWLSPMTKAPTPTEMSKGQSDNTEDSLADCR